MPVQSFHEHGAFTPEDVRRITTAFEDCVFALGLTKHSDPTTQVAKRIIELAKLQMDIDPASLREQVLRSFKKNAA